MKLIELIQAVKEEKLSKEQLEAYRDQLSNLYADMQIEMATLEKEEASFMCDPDVSDRSVAERKVLWKGRQSGQRLITLKRYAIATKEMINSLKSRIYDKIY